MKKLCLFIMLTVTHTFNLLSMDDPVFVERQRVNVEQGAMLFKSPLKRIAERLDDHLYRHYKLEKKTPGYGDFSAEAFLRISKELVGRRLPSVNVIYGEPLGCEPLLYGINLGIAREIHHELDHNKTGAHLLAVDQGIHALVPEIKKRDISLSDNDAKILACAAMSSMLSLSEFKEISNAIRLSLVEDISKYRKFRTETSHSWCDSTNDMDIMCPPSNQTPTATHPTNGELRSQSEDEFMHRFTETLNQQIQKDLQTSQKVAHLEKNVTQPSAAQQIEKLHAAAAREEMNYQSIRNTLADAAEGFSAIMSIAGNHKVARQISVVGNAGIKIMDSCHMLATGASALSGLSCAMGTFSPLCPYVGIVSAVASLVSLFQDDGSDGLGEALSQIHQSVVQMHQSLSNQIYIVHEHMMERFDNLESKVDIMAAQMVQGFIKILEQSNYLRQDVRRMHVDMIQGFKAISQGLVALSQQILDSTVFNAYSFDRINSDLQVIHTVDAKVDSVLLESFVESVAAIDDCPKRLGSLAAMPQTEVYENCKKMENVIRGIKPIYNDTNGAVRAHLSPKNIIAMLGSKSPESILGFFAMYLSSQLSVPLSIAPSDVPNIGIFVCALKKYIALRKATTHLLYNERLYDERCEILNEIKDKGESALTFIHEIAGNRDIFEKLYGQYKGCYAKMLALFYVALEKRSQELFESVYAEGVEKNRQAIEQSALLRACHDCSLRRHPQDTCSECTLHQNSEKRRLDNCLAFLDQKKAQFKVDLTKSMKELLTYVNEDEITLNNFMVHESSCNNNDQLLPLQAHVLKGYMDQYALISERLGSGTIEHKYLVTPNKMISQKISFRKKNNDELQLGILVHSLPPEKQRAFLNYSCSRKQSRPFLHSQLQPNYFGLVHLGLAIWRSSHPSMSALDFLLSCDLVSQIDLLDGAGTRLKALRLEALDSLVAPTTELGVKFNLAAEELKSSFHALQTFGTISGLSKLETQVISAILPSDAHAHIRSCIESIDEKTNLKSGLEGVLVPDATLCSMMVPMQSANMFSRPLRNVLGELQQFTTSYADISRQREARVNAQHERAAHPTSQNSSRELELMQEIRDLRAHNAHSDRQMTQMMAMMQQMQQKLCTTNHT